MAKYTAVSEAKKLSWLRLILKNLPELSGSTWLILAILLHGLFYLCLNILCYWGLGSSLVDLGTFHQVLSMTAKGVAPTSSISFPDHPEYSWFGFHFSPLVLFLTPLYWISPSAEWLIMVHALCVSGTAWIIFHIVKAIGISEKEAAGWALCYLIHPVILYTSLWEFHEQSLALPLMALGIWATVTKRFYKLLVTMALLLLTKEHFGIVVAGFGILWMDYHHEWRRGVVLIGLGIFSFVGIIFGIMPWLNHGSHVMLSGYNPEKPYLNRYHWLGWEWNEALGQAIALMTSTETIMLIVMLVFPLVGLPLVGLMWLYPIAGEVLMNALSGFNKQRHFSSYYASTAIPFCIAASCFGIERLKRWIKPFNSKEILIACLIIEMMLLLLLFPSHSLLKEAPTEILTMKYWKQVKEVRSFLPKELSISADRGIGTYLADRKYIYRFPDRVNDAEAVVLYLANIPASKAEWFDVVSPDTQTPQWNHRYPVSEFLRVIQDPTLGVIYWKEHWLILKRHAPSYIPKAQIIEAMKHLTSPSLSPAL